MLVGEDIGDCVQIGLKVHARRLKHLLQRRRRGGLLGDDWDGQCQQKQACMRRPRRNFSAEYPIIREPLSPSRYALPLLTTLQSLCRWVASA